MDCGENAFLFDRIQACVIESSHVARDLGTVGISNFSSFHTFIIVDWNS